MVIFPLFSHNLAYLGMLEHLKCYLGRSLALFVEKKNFSFGFKKLNLIIGNWDAMSPKIQGPCSKLKRIQITKTQKSEFKKIIKRPLQ